MIKFIAEYYIKRACRKACDASPSDYYDIQTLLFTEIRLYDSESNDSTLYSAMLDSFNHASKLVLSHVSKELRK